MIELLVSPTARCDRGCSHCMYDSNVLGESISPSVLSTLPREFSRLGKGEKRFCVTGGGEPLLYPWTPKLIWEVMQDRRNWVDLVTSGCTDENDSGNRSLQLITDIFRSARLNSYLSFNVYNKTAEARVRYTLPLLRKINGLVTFKVAMSYEDRSPIEQLDGILLSMGYRPRLIEVRKPLSKRALRCLGEPEYLGELSDFSDQIYFRDNDFVDPSLEDGFCYYTQQLIRVRPQNLLIEGRAEKLAPTFEELLKHTSIRRHCAYQRESRDELLSINHTGAIYPCSMDMVCPDPELQLGVLGETPLWKALALRKEKIAKARRRTLLSPIGISSNPCGYCCDDRTDA